MKTPKTFIAPFVVIASIEQLIENFLESLADCKEGILIPFVKRCWPRWFSPNHLTLLRFGISLYLINHLFWCGVSGYQNQNWFAALVIFACVTDLFDGPVARALGKESKFGSLMDKVVDKFLILPLGAVEFWTIDRPLVILSVIGAAVVIVVAVYKYYQDEQAVPENVFGKVGMICYSFGIILAIWPAWQIVAWKIAWAGFAFGLSSVILNFRRHFNFPDSSLHH
ncbi:MAG: CDP-alcohol phosphatidyltransferase family protein [Candidatus Buchananbacteria bacterium]|nr:CDP-alcohol phosphatidyltransferase family protein [Candidatus Buchananbacteria bacterium]